MTEYISREAAIADSFTVQTREYGSVEVVSVENLVSLPSADVVEVVRCKECVYYHAFSDECGLCKYILRSEATSPNGYCSKGMRKDG